MEFVALISTILKKCHKEDSLEVNDQPLHIIYEMPNQNPSGVMGMPLLKGPLLK